MLLAVIVAATVFVAATNGANANFKGVASLYGSGTTSLRPALLWGTATTFCGALAAALLASGLLKQFGGRGLVAESLVADPLFVAAVGIGAASTSLLATQFGFPVSTTHALVGALLGAGLAAGGAIQWGALGKNFVLPLVVSPMLAGALAALLWPLLKAIGLASSHRTPALDAAHFASTGAASFARGLNDAPKMAALLMAAPEADANVAIVTVALAMAAGGLAGGRRVAETLGKGVTAMNPGQGFAASLATAGLVTTASLHALPASTTHVAVGAMGGIGSITRQAHWRKIGEIAVAWVTTVPCGALLAAVAWWAIRLTAGSRLGN